MKIELSKPDTDRNMDNELVDGANAAIRSTKRFRPEPRNRKPARQALFPRNMKLTSRMARYWIWFSHAVMAAVVVMVLSRFTPGEPGMLTLPMVLTAVGLLFAAGLAAHLAFVRTSEARSVLEGDIRQLQGELERNADELWELRESEERYRNLSEVFGDIVFYRNESGEVTYANQALADLAGEKLSDLIGRPFGFEVTTEKLLAGSPGALHGTREVRIETSAGTRWFIWLDMPVRSTDGFSSETVTIARDISIQKEAELALLKAREKAEAASRAKTRFLATVSHEMRTPLNGILGMSRLLEQSRLTKAQESYNEAIHSSGAALLSLIEDMLDITKIEAGRFERRDERFSPKAMVEEVSELLSSRAYAKSIEIGAFVHPDVPETIVADQGRIRQVLINLLGNAIKFTETGGVSVELSAKVLPLSDPDRPDSQPGQLQICLDVTDDGPGLAPQDMGRIFEEFEQVETVSTRKHGGAGLGLSISQGIAREIGGSLSVSSEPGKGSTFRFSFVAGGECRNTAIAEVTGHDILLVSCGQTETRMLRKQAEAIGHKVTECKTIANAVGVLTRDNRYERMIVNVEGFQDISRSIGELKAMMLPSARLIVVLKPQMRDQLDKYLELGCDGYLIRPVRLSSLERILAGETGMFDTGPREAVGLGKREETSEEPVATCHPVTGNPLRILLAEDNDINALLARTTLEKAGHEVNWVTNGRLAVDKWQEKADGPTPFDCVLMDLHMPVMDGLDAIEEIRTREKAVLSNRGPASANTRIPILALTADEQDEVRSRCTAVGADGFLVKPFDPARLQQAVQETRFRQTG